jgi:plastocyanin
MNRRIRLIAISWVGALTGLTLLTLALTANMPAQARMADSSVSVSITESGFDPSVVTITEGTAVVWINNTQETVYLVSGVSHHIYLPLVLGNAGGVGAAAASPPMAGAVVIQQQDDWGTVDIAPGESYTHTFAAAGDYSCFLLGYPERTGLIIVQPPIPGTTFYLCRDGGDYVLSTTSCSAGNIIAGLTDIRFETELTGDIAGTDYEFAIMLATQPEGASPSVDAQIILDQGGQETVLASTTFVVDNFGGDSPPYDYMLYTASESGLDPNSSAGDHLILSVVNNGPGTMLLRWGSDYSSITIPGIIE